MSNLFSRELEAFSGTKCDNCGDNIFEGDPLFFGRADDIEGQKFCQDCKEEYEEENPEDDTDLKDYIQQYKF